MIKASVCLPPVSKSRDHQTRARVAVGSLLSVEIADLGRDGQGVGRVGDQVVFVADALPGELVRVRVVHQARRHLVAELKGIERPSPDRRQPPCILSDNCGGCSLQHCSDAAQVSWKQGMVGEVLRRLGGTDLPPLPLLAAESPLGYRNRAVIPLELTDELRLRAGFYRRGSHQIVNMNHCPVLDARLDRLIEPLKEDLEEAAWPVDRHGRSGGGLRHLALRVGHHTGDVLITLIASNDNLPGLDALASSWMDRWPEVVGVSLNLQPEPNNKLMGHETRTLCGRDWLEERFAGLRYRIAADTFFQVNTVQAERVVPLLLAALKAAGTSRSVIDAYCGIGTYTLPIAAAGYRVEGIEAHLASVQLARRNAESNGLSALARFSNSDVAEALAQSLPGAGALLLDPPRKGLEPPVLEAILNSPPPLLLYLSCDPGTLARDLGRLCGTRQAPQTDPSVCAEASADAEANADAGTGAEALAEPEAARFRLLSVQPLDFFPNTSHVETLVVLERCA
ncbi:23S rRNA (uracil(1939)-C(5))-methyltransferase RlmD [Synechococcus sp. CBW1002]|uniref:23S rRNA (uracil(1939)-C(5))-methyltransferase RlmD n=1 Tax=Synechococcus sp. CBW1002 TaxID=1353134 RepID=UPI0018CF05F5|nr:23S rRNA (uracil(1939)-C(5))-methyltransferase RlmD [Synechococcus sp. CBW1002]QPN59519.1 23S rRNA (uracil(1939)-C(5))-methyltransferase RlmD [Synechococcus sp. CBW1002]